MWSRTREIFKIAKSNIPLDVNASVRRSLERGAPIVALESTIITHGMPFPENLRTACDVEQLVRDKGVTPATIAVLDGRVKIGLTNEELTKLASSPQERSIKCSKRDLPYVMATDRNGGTTVAATMWLAQQVGIKIFATGGVGGVHRDGQSTLDVSADLVELGQTPVAVVCSGVKSILDIPRTLEYLETQGVCVATYGNANGNFPDFYTRDSGCRVPYNLANAVEAARLINALHALQLQSGILIGVPVPEAYAADKAIISAAIEQAHVEAAEQGVTGKALTPFLLAAIAKITKGNSLQANMALIRNNASVAAEIACELQRLEAHAFVPAAPAQAEETQQQPAVEVESQAPLVIGASILDLSLTLQDEFPATLDGATYNTGAKQSAGGVGRNLAEGLYKLHGSVNFISAVGHDQLGESLLHMMPTSLRHAVRVDDEHATSLCSVIFDKRGDCKLVLGNMEIHNSIKPADVLANEHLMAQAPLVIFDSNLSLETIACVLRLAAKHQRPVLFEPTDMRIAAKPFQLPRALTQQIKIITPNLYELTAIVEALTATPIARKPHVSEPLDTLLPSVKLLLHCVQHEFDHVLITLGHHGIVLSTTAPMTDGAGILATSATTANSSESQKVRTMRFYAAPRIDAITNVSGAGDSFSSGFIAGAMRAYDIDRCVALGFLAAERALKSDSAVPLEYFSNKKEEATQVQRMLATLQWQNL